MAVAFSMIAAYILSRTLVPACSAFWLKAARPRLTATATAVTTTATRPGEHSRARDLHDQRQWPRPRRRAVRRASSGPSRRWEEMIDAGHRLLRQGPRRRAPAPRPRRSVVGLRPAGGDHRASCGRSCAASSSPRSTPARSRCTSGPRAALRIEETEKRIKAVEDFVRKTIDEEDLQLILSEIGVTSDWSAAYTPNAGPMDAVVKIQLTDERTKSAQEYVQMLRTAFATTTRVQRPGVRLRRRRHGPLGDERGQVDADQHPGHRQEPEDRPQDRHGDQERGRQDRRRRRRPGHPAARLSRST